MQVYNIPQLSDEWFAVRQRKMTASHAQAIGANGKGLITYTRQIMAEYYSTAEKVQFSNEHTERGSELEKYAVMEYSLKNMVKVKSIGFVEYNEFVGCSPDGLVDDDGLIEIKCLSDKVYLDLLLDKKIDTKYLWQIQMQLLICEREYCDFVAFNPNFENNLWVKRIMPDPKKVAKLKDGIVSGIEMILEIESKIKDAA